MKVGIADVGGKHRRIRPRQKIGLTQAREPKEVML